MAGSDKEDIYSYVGTEDFYLKLYENASELFDEGNYKEAKVRAMMSFNEIGVPPKGEYTPKTVICAKDLRIIAASYAALSRDGGFFNSLKKKRNINEAKSFYDYACDILGECEKELSPEDYLLLHDILAESAAFDVEVFDDSRAFKTYKRAYMLLRDSEHFKEMILETGPRALNDLEVIADYADGDEDYAMAANMVIQSKDITEMMAKAGPEKYEDKIKEYDERLASLVKEGNLTAIENPDFKG